MHTTVDHALQEKSEQKNAILGDMISKGSQQSVFQKFMQQVDGSLSYIVGLWFAGFIFFTFRFFGSYFYIYRLRTRYSYLLSQKWQDLVSQIQTKLNIRKSIILLESATTSIPMVVGHLKPAIILPLGLITQIPFNQLEAILVHELAHIRRNDYLVNLVVASMEWLFFFHPLFWWMTSQLDLYREHSCDDITINHCGGADPLQKALLDLSEFNQKSIHIAAALYKNEYQLLKRIKRMKTKNQKNHGRRFNPAALLLMMAMFIIVLLGSSFVPQPGEMFTGLVYSGNIDPGHAMLPRTYPVKTVEHKPETILPDTTKATKKGTDVKEFNDDGTINLELDAEGNLLMVKKDGKELTGKEREKYDKLAKKLQALKEEDKVREQNKEELDRVKEQLRKAELKMKEVQAEYSEVMKEYMTVRSEAGWSAYDNAWGLHSEELMSTKEMEELLEHTEDLAGIYNHNFFTEELEGYEQWTDLQKDLFTDQFNSVQEQLDVIAEQEELEGFFMEELITKQYEEFEELEELAGWEELDQIALETQIFEKVIRNELVKDGLMKSPMDKLSMSLSKKRLVVNGEKQPADLHEKYLKIYNEYSSTELTGDTRFILED